MQRAARALGLSLGQQREVGIRLALGSSRARVLGQVLLESQILAAVLLAPRLEPLLYDTSPRDPAVLLAVTATLVTIGLVAGLLPARRANRIDPSVALRAE